MKKQSLTLAILMATSALAISVARAETTPAAPQAAAPAKMEEKKEMPVTAKTETGMMKDEKKMDEKGMEMKKETPAPAAVPATPPTPEKK